MDNTTKEKELLEELKKVQLEKKKEEDIRIKKQNFEKFMNRKSDYMIWKAHCDMEFINVRYSSDIEKELLPYWVSISWNCSHTYIPNAPITSSTKTYLHNVWADSDRNKFEEDLLKLVKKYVSKNCSNLHSVLEMMWLQSLYWIERSFLSEDIPKIEKDIEKAQKEILDKYTDKDFEKLDSLYHSSRILHTYIKNNRKHLLGIKPIERFNEIKDEQN